MSDEYDWMGAIKFMYPKYRSNWTDNSESAFAPQGRVEIPMDGEYPFLKAAVARRYIDNE